jgi:hypothetical protein
MTTPGPNLRSSLLFSDQRFPHMVAIVNPIPENDI